MAPEFAIRILFLQNHSKIRWGTILQPMPRMQLQKLQILTDANNTFHCEKLDKAEQSAASVAS